MTTRDRLLHSALHLFARKGYNSTSIADVLDDAGANAGSLYHFFPTKQDLLVTVLEAYRDGIEPMLLTPAWGDIEDPIERVFALLARYRAALVATDFLYGCPIGSLALELHEPDPAVRNGIAVNFTAWRSAVADCYRAAAPRFATKVDPEQLATFTLTTMEGAVMLARTYRSAELFDDAVSALRSYIDSLLTPTVEEKRKGRRKK